MNIELLQQVKARILAEPEAFRMDTWSCGTAHCIAGWALELSGHKIRNPDDAPYDQCLLYGGDPAAVAAELLGLANVEIFDEADRLFLDDMWPDDLRWAYQEAKSRLAKATIAADRIDLFIASNGRE